MDLQHIDVCPESLDARFDGVEDVLSAEADLVHHSAVVDAHGAGHACGVVGGDAEEAFGEDDEFLARDGVLFDGFADYAFGFAVGVDVCCLRKTSMCWSEKEEGEWAGVTYVPGIEAQIIGVFEKRQRS